MMKYLYYCNSAYQLINVLNLDWHRKHGFEDIGKYEADLLVLNAFKGAKELSDIVREKGIFKRVMFIEKAEDNSGALHLFKSVSDIVFPGNYLKKKFGLDKKELSYDVLTFPKFSRVLGAIYQLNPKAELQLYEDGLASYYFDYDLVISRSRSYKLLYKRFNHGRDFLDFSHLYLSQPEMFTGDYSERVKKIPVYDRGYLEEVRKMFAAFAGDPAEYDKRLLWFSQSMFDDHEVLDVLKGYANDVLFCPHPRYPTSCDDFMISAGNQIWELKALNIPELEKKCLISIHSTALLTPKLLYDLEPYIIIVAKLVPLPYEWDFFGRSLDLFKKRYRDPNRVMIPETMDEFRKCLEFVLRVKD